MTFARLKTLAFGVLTLVLMALTASSAGAETGANWRVNGTNISATLKPRLQESTTFASLLTTILGIPTEIECTVLESTSQSLGSTGGVSEGTALFTGCATYLKGSIFPSAPCLPKTSGLSDRIETKAVAGLLVLSFAEPRVLIKSVTGGPLTVVESSEECAVGQKINITGTLALKDFEMKKELESHWFEVDNVSSTLKASGQAASIDAGPISVRLIFAHIGLKWSGQPA